VLQQLTRDADAVSRDIQLSLYSHLAVQDSDFTSGRNAPDSASYSRHIFQRESH